MKLQGLLLASLFAAAIALPASAHEIVYTAILSGPAESPPNASPGTGSVTVTLDLDLITLRVQADFSGLTGTTTASHIHCCTAVAGVSTAIVATQTPSFLDFPLGVTSGTYDHTFDLAVAGSYNAAFITASGGTVSDALNALIAGLDAGKAYFNIHTSTFGGGEIRGFLTAVPEPSALALLGVAGLVRARRRAV
jgi:hypothetical protein